MIEAINNHRTIRKYKSDPIPQHILEEILTAGVRASNTGNMQLYSMIVTTDSFLKEKLWVSHFKQDMVKIAPVVITFCADYNRFARWCNMRNATPGFDNFLSFTTGAIDALLVAQNVCIAAEDLGLGICYLGTTTYNAEQIIDILNMPVGVVPVTTIVLGYPDEAPEALTDRLPLEAVVHNQTYTDYSDGDIGYLYREKENLPYHKELLATNNKETLAQIFTDIRYKKSDNVAFSNKLIQVLHNQGFMNNQME